jgi:hypothetical protein
MPITPAFVIAQTATPDTSIVEMLDLVFRGIRKEAYLTTATGDETRQPRLNVSAVADGVRGGFEIDTRSSTALVLQRRFVEQHGLEARHPDGLRIKVGGIGGVFETVATRLDRFDLAASKISRDEGGIPVAGIDGSIGYHPTPVRDHIRLLPSRIGRARPSKVGPNSSNRSEFLSPPMPSSTRVTFSTAGWTRSSLIDGTWRNIKAGQSTFAMAARRRRNGGHSLCAKAWHKAAVASLSWLPRRNERCNVPVIFIAGSDSVLERFVPSLALASFDR